MNAWLAVGVAGAVVVTLRVLFVVGNGHLRVPAWSDRASRFVAPSVTAALLAPRVFAAGGHLALSPDVLAFALAVPVAIRTRSVLWTLAVGMPLVWAARALG